MEFGHDNYQDFFDKLQSNNEPRNLRQIFEDDNKPLQSESKNLRYQPQSSNKQAKQKQQHHQHKQHEHQEQKHKSKVHSPGSCNKRQEVGPPECWKTIVAKVAHGYNGNDNVGRVGVALSRNSVGASKLVVYKNRNQLLSTLLLTKSPQSSCPRSGSSNVRLRESYMQFYDDGRRFWSLRFEQPKDEEAFTEELLKIGLPIENMRTEQANNANSNSPPVLPQPLPRQQISTPAAEPPSASMGYDSGSESTQSTEEVIASHRPGSIKNALIPLATNSSILSVTAAPQTEQPPANKLELYLDEQRATGHAIDKKMDTILQAMYRLASTGNLELNDSKDSVSSDPQGSNKLNSILQAMSRMANKNSMNQLGDSVDTTRYTTDNEDELLELEQKLLDLKKENRALMKNLRAKEQALSDLSASTCALCEELLAQNNELKQQNSTLLSALSKQSNNTATTTVTRATSPDNSCSYASGKCANCDQNLSKISELEGRTNASINPSGTTLKPVAGHLKSAVVTSRE